MEKTFTITQAANTWETEYARLGWTFGETPSAETLPAAKFGTAVVKYYTDEACTNEFIGDFSATTSAGTYYVKVTVAGTADYTALDKKYSYTIQKAKLDKPTANATFDFVYDNTDKTYLPMGYDPALMSISGNVQRNANETGYTVTVGIEYMDNYTWADGTQDDVIFTDFTISKAVYDMSGVRFEDGVFVENGEAIGLSVSGTLPEGVRVTYVHNGKLEPGRYTVTAQFEGDAENYLPIPDKSATLTVNRREISGGNGGEGEIIVTEPEQGFDPDYNVNIYDVTDCNPDLSAGEGKTTEKVVEIVIRKGDEIISPDRAMRVRVHVGDLGNKSLSIYRVNADGSLEAITAVREGEYLSFETSEMWKFAIASETEPVAPPADDMLGLKIGLLIGIIALIGVIAAVTVIVLKKKKDKKNEI